MATITQQSFERISDGVVALRLPTALDVPALIAGRDALFQRFLGPGSDAPEPTACIEVNGGLAGWIDYDYPRDWLQPDEVNIGYALFAQARGQGVATRALQLLMHHLALRTSVQVGTLLIRSDNDRSLAVARRAGFADAGIVNGSRFFKRSVPALHYDHGELSLRPQSIADVDADLDAKDDEQMRWLWLPSEREQWLTMSVAARRDHVRRTLQSNVDAFGRGPKWCFSIDSRVAQCVAYIDCDLANDRVPAGEANISYAVHPGHRGRGVARCAVRLMLRFLCDHTGTAHAHLIVDAANRASRRVAESVAGPAIESLCDERGGVLLRHTIGLR